MSMISAQIDRLRERAKGLRVLANGPVNEGFPAREKLFEAADAMYQAADTIWELRCKLAGMVDMRERARVAEVESAKLRELLSKVYGYYVSGTLTPCDFCDKYCCEGDAPTTCKSDEYDPDGIVVKEVEQRMRELGVEVE
jgi:hypothetical protein